MRKEVQASGRALWSRLAAFGDAVLALILSLLTVDIELPRGSAGALPREAGPGAEPARAASGSDAPVEGAG